MTHQKEFWRWMEYDSEIDYESEYTASTNCGNCHTTGAVIIRKGHKQLKNVTCKHCGCKTVYSY